MFKIILNQKTVFFCALIVCFASCTKDYITGGTIENANQYANTSTYDVLSQNPQFDTLVQLIDAAGLKDAVNKDGTTFFAVSNLSIFAYLQRRTFDEQSINQYAKFGLDSLLYYVKNNINHTADSLLMYIINTKTTPQNLTETGSKFHTQLAGDNVIVSYEETTDGSLGYSSIVSTAPRVVYFTQLWKAYNLSPAHPASDVPSSIGVRTLVRTSFINTKNGVINVLSTGISLTSSSAGILFFYGTK